MKHVHHDMIVEWVKDTSRVVQRLNRFTNTWIDEGWPNWYPGCVYRFEPKHIIVNGVNVPEPVREPLKDGQQFCFADPTQINLWIGSWANTAAEKRMLSLGLIHLTREAAQAHIDAMLLPSRSDK